MLATVVDFAAARQPAYQDPIPGIISFGSVNMLAGASGVGKTCLLSGILKAIHDGVPVFGHLTNTPAKIAYIGADRGFGTASYWLGKAGYSNLPFYSLCDDPTFNLVKLRNKFQLVKVLAECLDKLQLPPGSLAVVDPLALFMGGNLNDYMNCAIACLEIRREITQRQITLLGTAHASKQKGDKKEQYTRLQDRILGSGAQLAYCDTQMYLASPEETRQKWHTFAWTSHMAVGEEIPLGRDERGLFVPYGASMRSSDEGKLLALIPSGAADIGFGELVLASELSRASVHRFLQDFLTDGTIEKVGHGRYRRVEKDAYTQDPSDIAP